MKFFKVTLIALITVFAFGNVEAQNRGPRRVVVVKKRVAHHRHYRHHPVNHHRH